MPEIEYLVAVRQHKQLGIGIDGLVDRPGKSETGAQHAPPDGMHNDRNVNGRDTGV